MNERNVMSKLWGRFAKEVHDLLRQFNDSIDFDQRLRRKTLKAAWWWARGLVGAGVDGDGNRIRLCIKVGNGFFAKIEESAFTIQPGDEDIHTANETSDRTHR